MGNNFSGDANLQALYRFESGEITTDSSGKGNTLTNTGGVGESTVDYKEGGCSADFAGGIFEYMSIADASLSANFPWASDGTDMSGSIVLWIKADSINAGEYLFSKWTALFNKRQLLCLINAAGTGWSVMISSDGTALGNETLYDGGTFQTGRWYHFAFTWNQSTKAWILKIWDDTGASYVVDTGGTATNTIAAKDGVFAIGSSLDCRMDEMAIFNDVLTSNEIIAIKNGLFGASAVSKSGSQTCSGNQSRNLNLKRSYTGGNVRVNW